MYTTVGIKENRARQKMEVRKVAPCASWSCAAVAATMRLWNNYSQYIVSRPVCLLEAPLASSPTKWITTRYRAGVRMKTDASVWNIYMNTEPTPPTEVSYEHGPNADVVVPPMRRL
ncbi:hypothetical protein PV327_004498 [Microctonus hyperodae]|uniref:Uncharacterized protein n=1 Tax=Microctonus hyperodae TaxID=165561 RepID=A0AA39KMR6_MICHY|nr:hypothetical protein PV327_004498 [Microctonus hyperodae]